MSLVVLVRAMQMLCALCWMIPFLACWPSLVRVLAGKAKGDDPIWFVIWFMACSQVGFIARWFLFGAVIPSMRREELVMWSGMYLLSAAVAIAAMLVVRRSGRPRE